MGAIAMQREWERLSGASLGVCVVYSSLTLSDRFFQKGNTLVYINCLDLARAENYSLHQMTATLNRLHQMTATLNRLHQMTATLNRSHQMTANSQQVAPDDSHTQQVAPDDSHTQRAVPDDSHAQQEDPALNNPSQLAFSSAQLAGGSTHEVRPVFVISKNSPGGHRFTVSAACWYPIDTGLFVSASYDETLRVTITAMPSHDKSTTTAYGTCDMSTTTAHNSITAMPSHDKTTTTAYS
eukprot:gene190-3977_t